MPNAATAKLRAATEKLQTAVDRRVGLVSELPVELLQRQVAGSGLNSAVRAGVYPTLRDQLSDDGPTLLAFLRDFGCIFCREMIKDVRVAAETADRESGPRRFPRVVFVHQASVESGERFFGRYWPGVPAISDPDKHLYEAVGLGRGSVLQLLGPRVWVSGVRALVKGHVPGMKRDGDKWTMPGLLLVDPPAGDESPGVVRWSHRFRHAADSPDFHTLAHQKPAA